jgi:hypothetical protein
VIYLDLTKSMLTLMFQAPNASKGLYRQNLGELQKKSGNTNMPVYSKFEVDTILGNMNHKKIEQKLKTEKLDKTPERTAAMKASERLRATSIQANSSPASQVQRSTAPSGIFGYNFKGKSIDQMITKNEKRLQDQMKRDGLDKMPETPEAPRVLVRSSSVPEPSVIIEDVLPKLIRSKSNESPGAAIKAALGSDLFASFRRANLAGVLDKVKTHLGEHNIVEAINKADDEDNPTSFDIVSSFEDRMRSNEADELERVKDPATFAIEHQSHLRRLRLKSMCQEYESEETRQALDRVSAADKTHSTNQRIQKVWRFDQIAEVPIRPYSGLRKNADAARRPSSAINFKLGNVVQTTPRLNQSAFNRSLSATAEASGQEKSQIPRVLDKVTNENKARERSSMGPGGFWREGLHSASIEAIHRKMPEFIASIAEIKNSSSNCDVCMSLCCKDAHGRCKYCGA